MCRCMQCNRTIQEILPKKLTDTESEIPLLYLGRGAITVCIRCSTEHAIGLILYGLPVYVYDKKNKVYKTTAPEFENLKTNSISDSKNNFALYREVLKRTEKPKRVHLS